MYFFLPNLFPFHINVQCVVLSPGTYNVLTIWLHQYHYVHLYYPNGKVVAVLMTTYTGAAI